MVEEYLYVENKGSLNCTKSYGRLGGEKRAYVWYSSCKGEY